jgi:hypothetical protein
VIDTATAPASNLDLSASVLRFARGGAINPTTGITVTLGVFTAPRVQIFGGAGNIRFSGKANPVFYPEWWGVKGDAYTANDGAITAASAAFSSASHPSTSVDVNKNVILYGAGTLSGTSGLNNALRTTVSSVPGGNYTLAATATATVSGAYFAMGTSNTTAMQKCFDSLPSFSMVHFAPGKYMLLTGTVRVGATQEQSNISITNNTFRGPLKLGTAFIQNKGNYLQRDIKFSGNIFDNSNGSALSSTMGINNANQTASAQQVVNFEAIGNVFLGDYDFAAFRAGNIGSGLIDANQFTPLSLGMRLFRIGTVSNLIISNNRLNNAGVGMYFVDGSASNLVVKDNNIIIGGVNNSVGVYIEAQSQAFAATFLRNTIIGPGGTFTNIYGIQDVEAGGGDTSGVIYLDNIITNINTTTALGSFKYRTLPDNALVTELPPATIPQLLSQNSSNNSTTPDVRGVSIVQEAYSASRTITAINNASPGVPFTIMFTTGNVTIQNNASIKLAGGVDFVATASDSITVN